jgi:hypothetical protein
MTNRKIVIFIPNGIGDVLMIIPTIRRLLLVRDIDTLVIVVSNRTQKNLLHDAISSELKILCRFDNFPFSQFRLLLKIALINAEICFAPLISKKLKNN